MRTISSTRSALPSTSGRHDGTLTLILLCDAGVPIGATCYETNYNCNTEEYYAWMIEGMYCSQRGIPVRRSYHDWSRQRFEDNPRGRGNPYVGLQHYWVERFFREIPTLARALASIPEPRCQFNPFRDYVTGDYRRSSTIRPVYSAAHPIAARPPPGPPIPSSDIFD